MEYSVKGVKEFEGMENKGFNASLYHGNTKIATVIDEGRGGEVLFRWIDPAEKAIFKTFSASQPPIVIEGYDPVPVTMGLMVARLVDEFLTVAELRRACKGKTLYRLKGDKTDQWRVLKAAFSKPIESIIIDRHGDALEEILNKRFV